MVAERRLHVPPKRAPNVRERVENMVCYAACVVSRVVQIDDGLWIYKIDTKIDFKKS